MAKDDEILAALKRMEERVAAAEARAEAAERKLVSSGLVERVVPPMPAPEKGLFRYFNTQTWAWEKRDSPKFRIVEPRWLPNSLDPKARPKLIEADPKKPAIVVMADGAWIDKGLQPEAEPYTPPTPLHPGAVPGGGKEVGTSAGFFGIAEEVTSGRPSDQTV